MSANRDLYYGIFCGIVKTDYSGKILFMNDYLKKIVFLNVEVGSNIQHLSPQLFKQISQKHFQNANKPVTISFISKGKKHTNTSVYSFYDDKEVIFTILPMENDVKNHANESTVNEITSKQMQDDCREQIKLLKDKINRLKRNEVISKQISEVGRVGGWDISLITGKVFWSDVTKQIHEVPKDFQSTIELGINFYKEGESREVIQRVVNNLICYGEPFDVELQIITVNGVEKWVRAIGFAKRTKDVSVKLSEPFESMVPQNANLKTVGIYGTFQDIDKQKKLVLSLEEINKKTYSDNVYLKSIVESDSFYVTKTDIVGNYTYINPGLCEALSVKAEDWIGKNSLGLIIPEDHQKCIDTVNKCFENPNKSQWVILRKPTPAGIITNQWEFRILYDDQSKFSEFLCIGLDITTLIKKQEELQRLLEITEIQNKRLENFTHIVSHNIRSHVANLNGILSITDMEIKEERHYANKLIKDVVLSLDETIHNLNDIILIQSTHQLAKSPINIKKEILRIIKIIQLMVEDHQAIFKLNFSDDELINTNLAYFESIFLNLFTNAIKYKSLSRVPVIEVNLTTTQQHKIFEICDNGRGIDLHRHKDKIFGMYKTFHGNSDAKGMGLFIVKTQVEALGGKIDVESEVNVGTKFKIHILN